MIVDTQDLNVSIEHVILAAIMDLAINLLEHVHVTKVIQEATVAKKKKQIFAPTIAQVIAMVFAGNLVNNVTVGKIGLELIVANLKLSLSNV